ncbi:MAG: 2-hydroxychromene-2-carboxylate isomerase [Labrys sp. (in: a-proteobacteria)]
MSRRTIDYYLSLASPWAYMGHPVLMDIAARHDLSVHVKPVFLGQVFAETGGLPVPKRHPARQRYRFVDLQRWRERRGLWFNIRPKYWPFDVNLVDRFIIAIVQAGLDPDPFLRLAYAGVWEKDQNLADEATIVKLAGEAGLEARPLLAAARSEATETAYEQNFRDAVAADVFGSPSYVLDGEVFWGQDRLDMLDFALSSKRPAYSALV